MQQMMYKCGRQELCAHIELCGVLSALATSVKEEDSYEILQYIRYNNYITHRLLFNTLCERIKLAYKI